MPDTIRVDFHCHTSHSDGLLDPSQLVGELSRMNVRFAALTDHDTTGGLAAFTEACAREGIACVSGVEMTVGDDNQLVHLLGYGFDPAHIPLQEALARTRARRAGKTEAGLGLAVGEEELRPLAGDVVRNHSWLQELSLAIALIHDAGGRAFLAHPLALVQDAEALDTLLDEARKVGLDGVEAYYGRSSDPERRFVADLAAKHGLTVSGGSDYHGTGRTGPARPGVDMPGALWRSFRDSVISARASRTGPDLPMAATDGIHPQDRGFLYRIVLPALLTIVLFVVVLFAVILPELEGQLLDRKRELIRELTRSAWSVLAEYHQMETAGTLSRELAKREAMERVRGLRYGPDRKDYFWITDSHPTMLMHPYRPDLDGDDLSSLEDRNGVRLFVEFVRKVRDDSEGYVQYVWQWKDDPGRLVPKESYVMGFEPWGWIIGTGLYVEDVRGEIGRISARLITVSALISGAVVLLLMLLLYQSLKIEGRRRSTTSALHASYEKYRALAEASREATLLVLDRRCTYANAVAQEMFGYSSDEFALLDVPDLVDAGPGSDGDPSDAVKAVLLGRECLVPTEARIRRKDGVIRDVVLTAAKVSYAGRSGVLLSARDAGRQEFVEEALDASRGRFRALMGHLDLGVFHAEMIEGGRLSELNPAGRRILGLPVEGELPSSNLMEFFRDEADARVFLHNLREEGSVRGRLLWLRRYDGERVLVSLSAALGRYGREGREYYDGVFEDVTERKRAEADREAMIAELQSSLLFLNEPLRSQPAGLAVCSLDDSIEVVAARMAREGSSAMAVATADGAAVGIVTDRDLCERVLVAKRDIRRPIHEVMTAPVIAVEQRALVYEALLLMQQHDIQHLAVRDDSGKIVSLVRARDLVRFDRYSSAVLADQLGKAASVDELAAGQRRLPTLVKGLIDSGTRTRAITQVATTVSDTIVGRLIRLATEEIGPPPVAFAFLALGSEGRGEQTLVTDQDNALVFADGTEGGVDAHKAWFLELGTRVCDGLNAVGYAWCRGELMAKNPQWTQPLSVWKRTFSNWVATVGPQELMDINKFFDFRCVYGELDLANELRSHVEDAIRRDPPFFKHFAQNALLQKPPVGVFGQVQSGSGSRPDTVDLKFIQMLIVGFARLYALKHEVRETNTSDRLHRLHELGVTNTVQHREMVQAYEFLMRLRLAHQAKAMTSDLVPDNDLDPRELTAIEQKMFKQILHQIVGMQAKISYDFGLVQ
jgi:PAS domain S-box-containing protein